MRLHVRKLGLILLCAAAAGWYQRAEPVAQELAPCAVPIKHARRRVPRATRTSSLRPAPWPA